jgi:RNA recognition motif-containing protein
MQLVGSYTQQGSSPPYSATSFSTGKLNPTDQNPPINTLYVGNLPNTTPTSGFGPTLEESLRQLFAQCPGFRKLVYKYKNGNPMCFVEVGSSLLVNLDGS